MEFKFKKGIFLITGYNEIGLDSNGAGKSSVLNSIIWALFNRTSKGLTGKSVTRWGSEKPAMVTLHLSDSNNREYKIIRTPDSVDFIIDNVNTRGHKKDIQSTINDTFKTNYDLFLSSVMFTKGQADFLTDSGDAAKKRLFKSILGLEKIDRMYSKAKDIYDSLFSSAHTLEIDIKILESTISNLESEIEVYKTKNSTWESDKENKIKVLSLQLESSNPPLIDNSIEKKLLEAEKQSKELRNIIKHLEETIPDTQKHLTSVYKDLGYYRNTIGDLNQNLEDAKSIKGTTCRACGAKITKKGMESHITEITSQIEKYEKISTDLQNEMSVLEKDISSFERYKQELLDIKNDCQSYKSLLESHQHKLELFEKNKSQIVERIKLEKDVANPYSFLLDRKRKEYDGALETWNDKKTKFKIITSNIDTYAFIKWVLSREGVVSVIIEKIFGRLEALINMYLSSICAEGFIVSIKPQKELKSGAIKDEIDIVVHKRDQRILYSALSGGQEQRITIAMLMALYKLSKELGMNKFDFLLLDEVIDLSLSDKGQQDVMRLLHNLNEDIQNIFVISHKDGLASDFHFQIDVRMNRDGITYLKEINY